MTISKTICERNIKKIVNWANNKGYCVKFERDLEDEILDLEKIITINSSYKKEIQLYSLLHECGHALMLSNVKSYKKDYDIIYDSIFSNRKKKNINKFSKKYQVILISEEIEAWRRGKKLAKRLDIKIDEKLYNKEAYKWIFTYINHAYRCINKK